MNPWQRTLAVIVLIPVVVGLGFSVAALTNRQDLLTALGAASFGTTALILGGSLALLWIVVGAVNWQIREAAEARRR